MCITDHFFEEAHPGKSPQKKDIFCLSFVYFLDEIPKIKICHMVAKENTEVIEGRQRLFDVDFLDSEDKSEYASIDHYGAASDEEDGSGLLGAGVTEEVEDIQKSLKYFSLSSYILKPYHLITHGFENNRTAQRKLFRHMCNLGAPEKCREGRIVISSCLNVDTT